MKFFKKVIVLVIMNNHIEREKKLHEKYQEIWEKEIKFAKKAVYDWYHNFDGEFDKIINLRSKQFKYFAENDKRVLEITEANNYQLIESNENKKYRKQAEEYFYRIEKLAYEKLDEDNASPSEADDYLKRQERIYSLLKARKELEKNWVKRYAKWWERTWIEKQLEIIAKFFKDAAFLDILERIGQVSILIALIFWFVGFEERKQQKHYQAWNIINIARIKSNQANQAHQAHQASQKKGKIDHDGGRKIAIKDLYEDEVSLAYLDAPYANLKKIQLGQRTCVPLIEICWFKTANLLEANLLVANLEEAILSGANLKKAELSNANLKKADLSHAILSGAKMYDVDLFKADLSNAQVDGVILSDATLSDAKLPNANLRFSNLSNAILVNANLSGAMLSGANLSGAMLSGANLSGANLSKANLSNTDLLDAKYTTDNTVETVCKKLNIKYPCATIPSQEYLGKGMIPIETESDYAQYFGDNNN